MSQVVSPTSGDPVWGLLMASAVCTNRIVRLLSTIPLTKRSKSNLSFPCNFTNHFSRRSYRSISAVDNSFTWDDVFKVSLPETPGTVDADAADQSSILRGYFDKINSCNRGSEKQCDFLPFVIEGQMVGYIHKLFADHLRDFHDVFVFHQDSSFGAHIRLNPSLATPDEKTTAMAHVVQCMGKALIPGIRNELYPVKSSFGSPIIFSLERAAAPYFGIKAYGVHVNGYIERAGQEYLWIAKRSQVKPTFPGMLDHLVAGGLPHDIACGENVMKECEEEAGIPRTTSSRAIPVGAVSYVDINGFQFKRDVLFCYDLKLPEEFIPDNQDGEVESFKLIHVPQVANIIRKTNFFKSNCSLVIIDFLFRHGYINPEHDGYLDLLGSLRRGDCS